MYDFPYFSVTKMINDLFGYVTSVNDIIEGQWGRK